MRLFLYGETSMEWWMHATSRNASADRFGWEHLRECSPDARSLDYLASLAPYLSLPLHVLVEASRSKRCSPRCRTHVSTYRYPKGSFVLVASGVLASCPELTALHLSRGSAVPEAVRFASLLCSSFAFEKAGSGGLVERPAITSSKAIASYQRSNREVRGAKVLESAIPFIIEKAASPPEIDLAMRLTMPHRYGGFALPKPLVNARVDLGEKGRSIAQRTFVVPDLCWPKARLAIEYDSSAEHLTPAQAQKDSIKRIALERQGYKVIAVTSLMLKDPDTMSNVAEAVAKRLGVSLRLRRRDFERRQSELFALGGPAFPWSTFDKGPSHQNR